MLFIGCGDLVYKSSQGIDHETLVDYGEFLTDKNKVYRRYDTSDEVLILELQNVDLETFKPFGNSIYARDKCNIFSSRNGIIEEADVESFEAINIEVNGRLAYGKDKDNYFFWDQIVTDTIGFSEELKKTHLTNTEVIN